jgi:D-glycerate 3-kinase
MSTSARTLRWLPLVQTLAMRVICSAAPPKLLAIAGAQGSGKSTLARLLTDELVRLGHRAVTCSLDDFYLTRRERESLAGAVHPLLITRGVPGTHDVDLCERVIAQLSTETVRVPTFDKGLDDRSVPDSWPLAGPVDTIVFEGWCLGAQPQSRTALRIPVNDLERDEDGDGRWRTFVNDALDGPYRRLFARFDALVYLQVPDMDAVRRWRAEQEQQLPPQRRMNAVALERFVRHYERITRWMREDLPRRADLNVALGADHEIETVVTNRAF